MPSHMSLLAPFLPACASCNPIFAHAPCSCTKPTARFHAATCSGFVHAGATGRDARRRADTSVISVMIKPGAADRAATEMHEVPVVDQTRSSAEYMHIGETTTRFVQIHLA